ncbi:MAG: helix-turn-helix transcriptional regulator [Erysipelothrix sp.]
MSLGTRIYELRKSKEWSQEDFADELGVSRQTVSKWELDQSVPELDKIQRICELFDMTLDSLVNDNEEEDREEDQSVIKKETPFLRLFFLFVGIMLLSIPLMNEIDVSSNIMSVIVVSTLFISLYFLAQYVLKRKK